MTARVLLVEDEPALAIALRERFDAEGFLVDCAATLSEAWLCWNQSRPDLVVLDRMLPGGDGLELAREWRASGEQVPILMLTARGQVEDRVEGLDQGADDYLVKPFATQELLARMRALLRRHGPKGAGEPEVVDFGPFRFDLVNGLLTRQGQPVELSPRERDLMSYLTLHRDELLTRRDLLREVWGHRGPTSSRTVDVHVGQLRKKIEDDPHHPKYLRTVHRHGYRFCPIRC